jgi:hypothetical protein
LSSAANESSCWIPNRVLAVVSVLLVHRSARMVATSNKAGCHLEQGRADRHLELEDRPYELRGKLSTAPVFSGISKATRL